MQAEIVRAPKTGNHTVFLSGPPGTGKTTLAVERVQFLLEKGVPAEQILILVPQRTLAAPYYTVLHGTGAPPGGEVDVATIGGLARRTIEIFWPLISRPAGFTHPHRPPRFLTLETAQYYMDCIAEPFIEGGAFEGITISRARLISQIIDNLNKAAAVGFPVDQIAPRLKGAWEGESARLRIYDQVQALALSYRTACLAHNLLDWSLQLEIFGQHLLPLPAVRRYLLSGYRHLITDNTEEDIPASHELLRQWLPQCESALVIHDTDGGYRVFLGADPRGALALSEDCREHILLTRSYTTSPHVDSLGHHLSTLPTPAPAEGHKKGASPPPLAKATKASQTPASPAMVTEGEAPDPFQALILSPSTIRFHPEMLDWTAEQVSRLVFEEGVAPGEIAILAPFLSDALRFSLTEKLRRFNIPVRTHRPSRQLREEAAACCLLTLAKLAHPAWRRPPPPIDVIQALQLSIADLDPARAKLLANIVYRVKDGRPVLTPFHDIVPDTQHRISYLLGARYNELWQWLHLHTQQAVDEEDTFEIDEVNASDRPEELDHFVSRLFSEVLSQPGFGFHGNFDHGAVTANLIESIQKFRRSVFPIPPGGENAPGSVQESGAYSPATSLSLEYIDLVERGVVAAQYVASWQIRPQDAVLLVPAYTFLMMNQPVTVQFWLDAGSGSWFERIYQPLTHPYVLSSNWEEDQVWSDKHEDDARQQALSRLILGLGRRCRQRIYLAHSELNERGNQQQGPLLQAVQRLLRTHHRSSANDQEHGR